MLMGCCILISVLRSTGHVSGTTASGVPRLQYTCSKILIQCWLNNGPLYFITAFLGAELNKFNDTIFLIMDDARLLDNPKSSETREFTVPESTRLEKFGFKLELSSSTLSLSDYKVEIYDSARYYFKNSLFNLSYSKSNPGSSHQTPIVLKAGPLRSWNERYTVNFRRKLLSQRQRPLYNSTRRTRNHSSTFTI